MRSCQYCGGEIPSTDLAIWCNERDSHYHLKCYPKPIGNVPIDKERVNKHAKK